MKRKNFDGSDNLERDDLNKCPDCGCFFGGENCPLCGKPCPEEMKAGNRKPPEKKKTEKVKVVNYYAWYHTWWFIAVMMVLSPIVGIILLATSPRKTWVKILVSLLIIAPYVLTICLTYGTILFAGLSNAANEPVDVSLTQAEYIAECEAIDIEEFYRDYEEYTDKFVTFTVVVNEKISDTGIDAYGSKYPTYYICTPVDGEDFQILIRDCAQAHRRNYLPGDVITVYGEGAGNVTIYGTASIPVTAPCVYVAYTELTK